MFRSRKTEPALPNDVDIGEEMLVVVDRAINPFLVVFHDPSGFRAEQVRALRNKLVAMNPDGAAKTLVVTSAIKGEGKTVTALNLAMAFAELDRHPVLVVDADLRTSSVEEYLNLNPHPGLADVLVGRVQVQAAIRPSGVRNLSVLGPGTRLGSPSELLSQHRLDSLFARLKEQFQYVIVDTPPVMPATDASMVSSRADGTLLVVRLEHSAKSLTRQALRALQDLGGNVMGTFVTQVRGADPEADPRFGYESAARAQLVEES